MNSMCIIFIYLSISMNSKKPAVSKAPLFPWYETVETSSHGSKKKISLWIFILVIFLTFFVWFLVALFVSRSLWFSSSSSSDTRFALHQPVDLSGYLVADGDIMVYTHTLRLADNVRVWVKSRIYDLFLYTWWVMISGIVEKEFQDMPIIEITFITWTMISAEESLLTGASSQTWLYLPQVGIYLPASSMALYSFWWYPEAGVATFTDLTTQQAIPLVYFVCTASNPNKHCTQLQSNISAHAEKTLSSPSGVVAYKMEGVSSWFFTNNNLYGYFIHNVSDDVVERFFHSLVFPTESYVLAQYWSLLPTLCKDDTSSLMTVTKRTLILDTTYGWLVVLLEWTTWSGLATCKIALDLSYPQWWTLLSYIVNVPKESVVSSDGNSSSSSMSDISSNTSFSSSSVKQFPINLEKAMTFTSSKWYTITFPSSNISYESIPTDTSLGLPGVRCTTQMNVIKYADKALLHEQPTVSIYTCSFKWVLQNLDASLIQKEADNGMKFIIQIHDPAWIDFAQNVQIR